MGALLSVFMDFHALKDLEILVVDDQESNLLLVERILEQDGYTAALRPHAGTLHVEVR